MTEAKLPLPPDKRVLFLERIEAVVRLLHCNVQTAINGAITGLKYNAPPQQLFCSTSKMKLRSATAESAAGYVNRASNNWSAPTSHCIAQRRTQKRR